MLPEPNRDSSPGPDTYDDTDEDLDAIATRADRPGLHELPPRRIKTLTERQCTDLLVRTLERCGFEIRTEVTVYGHRKDGEPLRLRPDMLVSHFELPDMLGAIEVKSTDKAPSTSIKSRDRAVDVLKQASDYVDCWAKKDETSEVVNCRCLATGDIIRWAAIYPVIGFSEIYKNLHLDGVKLDLLAPSQIWLSAVVETHSKHYKVHPMFHRRLVGNKQALTLGYLDRHIIWDERDGWKNGAAAMLCGKRQVGGVRR